jgi:hypothetical protein
MSMTPEMFRREPEKMVSGEPRATKEDFAANALALALELAAERRLDELPDDLTPLVEVFRESRRK